jgi:hypothetical protein
LILGDVELLFPSRIAPSPISPNSRTIQKNLAIELARDHYDPEELTGLLAALNRLDAIFDQDVIPLRDASTDAISNWHHADTIQNVSHQIRLVGDKIAKIMEVNRRFNDDLSPTVGDYNAITNPLLLHLGELVSDSDEYEKIQNFPTVPRFLSRTIENCNFSMTAFKQWIESTRGNIQTKRRRVLDYNK